MWVALVADIIVAEDETPVGALRKAEQSGYPRDVIVLQHIDDQMRV